MERRFIAVRVNRNIKGHPVVQVQKSTDYNWETFLGFRDDADIPTANQFALQLGKEISESYLCYIPVYGLGGYGIGAFLRGQKYGKI